jgi:hypothetical protein
MKKEKKVSIEKYASRILYLQLKYMDRDFTDCTRNLVNDVLAIETKCQRKDYRGQNAEQYMNELERNLELWT